jgi:hypothetical protein
MNQRLRQERSAFLLFLGGLSIALMSALPVVTSSLASAKRALPEREREMRFEQVDLNRNGYIDRAEARVLPGLLAVIERADRSGDGRLDKVEYAQALGFLQDAARPAAHP